MAQNTEARRYSIPYHADLAHYADSTGKHIPYHDPVAERGVSRECVTGIGRMRTSDTQ